MRRCLVFLFLIHLVVGLMQLPLWTVTLHAAFSVVDAVAGGPGADKTTVVSPNLNSTGANLLLACVGMYDDVGTTEANHTFVDNKSNSWTPVTTRISGAGSDNVRMRAWYSQGGTVGTGHTVTYDNDGNVDPAVAFVALSGAVASPLDADVGVTAASGSTIQLPSTTPSEDNTILTVCATVYSGSAVTVDSGFVSPASPFQPYGGVGTSMDMQFSYKIQTTAGAEAPIVSTGSFRSVATMLVFKDGAAAPKCGEPGGPPRGSLGLLGVGC
jgi:hypothetical protein